MALKPQKQNVYDVLLAKFAELGLESLAPKLMELLQQGMSREAVVTELQNTEEYKQRFAGNEIIKKRIAAGGVGRVLSPREYIEQENAYRRAMREYGLPKGFYDSPEDFANWIGNDVSPAEIQSRAAAAAEAVTASNPEYRQALMEYYGVGEGDLVAFFLDQKRALPVLERQSRAAQIGGAAKEQGLNVDAGRADYLAGYGVDQSAARAGYAGIAQNLDELKKLSTIDKTDYTQADAEDAFLLDNAAAVNKTKKLASNERARFSGGSGIGQGSLASKSRGQY